MIPGMNSRQMRQMMQKMGVQQTEIDDVEQVIIRCSDKEIIIDNPQVSKVNMMGQKTWQVVGEEHEQELDSTPDINDEDIQTIIEQTGTDKDTALKTLEDTKGDLAEAIMKLSE